MSRTHKLLRHGAETLVLQFCQNVELGVPIKDAAVLAGFSERSVQRWLKDGKDRFDDMCTAEQEAADADNREYIEPEPSEEPVDICWRFWRRTVRSEAAHIQIHVSCVYTAAQSGNVKAALAVLRAQRPDNLREKKVLEVSGPDGGALPVATSFAGWPKEVLEQMVLEDGPKATLQK